jgi:hypothetical protein
MTLLRFPVDSVQAKVACAASLAGLSERWTADWQGFTLLSKVTAQQTASSMQGAYLCGLQPE